MRGKCSRNTDILRCNADAGEMRGRCRGEAREMHGEMQGRCETQLSLREDARELRDVSGKIGEMRGIFVGNVIFGHLSEKMKRRFRES
jgi:hypothetical protein